MESARAVHRSRRRIGRPLAGRVRLLAVAPILAVAALALGTSASAAVTRPAAPAIAPSLLTVRLNGTVVTHAAANLPLTQDIAFGTAYRLCCSGGTDTSKIFSSGWSIATLIAAAGATPATIRSVTIERAAPAADITLLGPDFDPATPGGLDFPKSVCTPESPPAGGDWSCPAFIYETDTGANQALSFLRPERATAPADNNLDDWIQSPVGAGLTIDITSIGHLDVKASADLTKARVGQTVRFTASATSPIAGERLDYVWSLSDGTTLQGANVSHAFADAGAYQAIATVSGSAGSGGSSAPVTVTVADKSGTPGPGGATSTTLPPTSGGDRDGSGPTSTTTQGTQTTTTADPGAAHAQGEAPVGKATDGTNRRGATPTSPRRRPIPTAAVGAGAGDSVIRGELLTASGVALGTPAATLAGGGKRATGAGGTHLTNTAHRNWGVFVGVGAVLALFLFGAGSERRPRMNAGGSS